MQALQVFLKGLTNDADRFVFCRFAAESAAFSKVISRTTWMVSSVDGPEFRQKIGKVRAGDAGAPIHGCCTRGPARCRIIRIRERGAHGSSQYVGRVERVSPESVRVITERLIA